MKRSSIILIVLFLTGISLTLDAFYPDKIKGSGNLITSTRTLKAFSKIECSLDATISLAQNESSELKLEAEDNIAPIIKTEVVGDKLTITADQSYSSQKPIKLYIPVKELKVIVMKGSGTLTNEGMLQSENLSLELLGSGNVNLNVTGKKLQTLLAGSGNIKISGIMEQHNTRVAGSGDVQAFDLKTQQTVAYMAGSGNCNISASVDLKASVAGSGDIIYKTAPLKISTSVSGSGSIRKAE